MRIAILGAGALGGYFGARLAQAGEDVAFVARGAQLAALRERGLRVRSAAGDVVLPRVAAAAEPREVGPVDAVLVTVKLWDTEDALRSAAPLVGARTVAISLQNGVGGPGAIAEALGAEHAAGGVAYIGAALAEPGTIEHVGTMARLIFGELDGSRSARLAALHAACRRAGIDATLSADVRRAIWEKFVFLVGLSGTTSLIRTTIGPIREDRGARRLLEDAMRETAAVARAEGVGLDDGYVEERMRFVDGLPAAMDSSMHVDLRRGSRLELPWLAGEVVRLGARHGIPTPVNGVIADALSLYAGGRAAAPAREG